MLFPIGCCVALCGLVIETESDEGKRASRSLLLAGLSLVLAALLVR